MRKLLSSILCVLMLFSLLGCMPQSSKGSVPSPTDLAPELKSQEALLIKSFVNDSKFMAKNTPPASILFPPGTHMSLRPMTFQPPK